MKYVLTAFIALTVAISGCKKDDHTSDDNNNNNNNEVILTQLQKDLIQWGPWQLTVNCGGEPCGYRTISFTENTIDYKAYNFDDTTNVSSATYAYTVSSDTLIYGTTTSLVQSIDTTTLTLCTLLDDCAIYTSIR